MSPSGEITRLLGDLKAGGAPASERLVSLVCAELRRMASAYLSRERADHTLQATALVHEAYIRLVNQRDQNWANRAHFFGVAAHLMRLILVDHARRKRAIRRGGATRTVSLDDALVFSEENLEDILILDQALTRLAEWDRRLARSVELRFFADLTVEETAEALGISSRSLRRDWRVARAWLHNELQQTDRGTHDGGPLGAD